MKNKKKIKRTAHVKHSTWYFWLKASTNLSPASIGNSHPAHLVENKALKSLIQYGLPSSKWKLPDPIACLLLNLYSIKDY